MIVECGGIRFDCEWDVDVDYSGESFVILTSVSIDNQDISEIIASAWWEKIEDQLIKNIEAHNKEMKFEAELDRCEAWGV